MCLCARGMFVSMTPSEWQQRFIAVSKELAHLADGHEVPGTDVSPHEGVLLEELDALEMQAAAMIRAGTAIE
jgi:hypothetical protein